MCSIAGCYKEMELFTQCCHEPLCENCSKTFYFGECVAHDPSGFEEKCKSCHEINDSVMICDVCNAYVCDQCYDNFNPQRYKCWCNKEHWYPKICECNPESPNSEGGWLCTRCHADMGPMNPRQLCGKVVCDEIHCNNCGGYLLDD